MKKVFVALILAVMLAVLLCPMAAAEISMPAYYINEVDYDGHVLCGHAIVPPGDYYARVTFVWENSFITVTIPISMTGDFILPIAVPCEMYSVEIIDQYSADVPGYTYAWAYCILGGAE